MEATASGLILIPSKIESSIGIDLGTTHSCVAVWRDGQVEIVTDKLGNRIIPSIIPITDFVTDNHASESCKSSTNYIYDVKRLIGRQFSDTSVQEDMKMWPFKVVNFCGKPFIAAGPENYVPPEQVSAILLSRLKGMAEEFLAVECVRDAIITVPAHFSDAQRQATKDAGEIAGLHVIQVLNEPTAAAYAYGFDNIAGDGYFLVYDLGGGTFDVTILHKVTADHVLKVVTCKGDSHLGGNDFDDRLVQHFCEKKGLDSHNVDLMNMLRYECRKAKHALSEEESTSFKLVDMQFEISRKEFEDLCAPFFTRTIDLLSKCLEEAKLDPSGIRDMILVGGSTRIPRIRQLLEEYFSKEVKHSINPDEAVAIGAALRVAVMTGAKSFDYIHGTRLVDVVTHSLGVEMVDGTVDILIPRNSFISKSTWKKFTTVRDNQTSVWVRVYEGERRLAKENRLLGEFELIGIAPAPAGEPDIMVTFEVSESGILNVKAEDMGSKNSGSITLKSNRGRLTESEINYMKGLTTREKRTIAVFDPGLDFTVDPSHVMPILTLIMSYGGVKDFEHQNWDLIARGLLPPIYQTEVFGESDIRRKIVRILESWVSCTEKKNRTWRKLMTSVGVWLPALTEFLVAKSGDLKTIKQ